MPYFGDDVNCADQAEPTVRPPVPTGIRVRQERRYLLNDETILIGLPESHCKIGMEIFSIREWLAILNILLTQAVVKEILPDNAPIEDALHRLDMVLAGREPLQSTPW